MANKDSGVDFNDEDKVPSSVSEDPDHKKSPKDPGNVRTQHETRLQRENIAWEQRNETLREKCMKKWKTLKSKQEEQEVLQNKREEILTDLGELLYTQDAEKNKERKSEQFERIFGTNKLISISTVQSKDTSLTTRDHSASLVRTVDPTTSAPLAHTPFVSENLNHTEFPKDAGNLQTLLEIQQKNATPKQQNKALQCLLAKYEDMIFSMEEQLEQLKDENNEILTDYGELSVKQTAKEKEIRNFEWFQKIFGTKQLLSTFKDESNEV